MVRVELAVYDLTQGMAAALSQQILGQRIDGIWHTGVVVFGFEYFFGGGIQKLPIGGFTAMQGIRPVQMLDMGETIKSRVELEGFLRTINSRFTVATYDLINNNCNNFSDAVVNFLIGHGIPSHIVDLPRIVFSTPGGAMLRPMIESMQSGIRGQSGGGMDPFGGITTGPPVSVPPATSSRSNGVNAYGQSQSQSASYTTVSTPSPATSASAVTIGAQRVEYSTTPLVLDSTPLVSGDAKTADIIGRKLLTVVDAEGNQALTDGDKAILTAVLTNLAETAAAASSSSEHSSEHSSGIPVEAYVVLGKIISQYPKQHMNCLFLLRILVLQADSSVLKPGTNSGNHGNSHSNSVSAASELIKSVVARLAAEEGSPEGLSSAASRVMALCTIANLLSHRSGIAFVFDKPSPSGSSVTGSSVSGSELVGSIVDIAVAGLHHVRVEVRQMSAAVAYNLILACTNDTCKDIVPAVWRLHPDDTASASQGGDVTDHELPPHAVQLLCGALEDIASEVDATVRYRRLVVACRIVRNGGLAARLLGSDLGFASTLVSAGFNGEQEKKLSLEIVRAFQSVQ